MGQVIEVKEGRTNGNEWEGDAKDRRKHGRGRDLYLPRLWCSSSTEVKVMFAHSYGKQVRNDDAQKLIVFEYVNYPFQTDMHLFLSSVIFTPTEGR